MYKRSPQKSPQFAILNLQSSVLTADRPMHWHGAEKGLRGSEIG
jgi:hypothetical protein